MSMMYYDKALVDKISKWVKDPNMTITAPSQTKRLFEYVADITDDKPIDLPLIAIRRQTDTQILNVNKRPLTYDGATIKANEINAQTLQAIPIKLGYQLDIYTRYEAEADEYVRNFVFNFINYPRIQVVIPYNDANIEHWSIIRLTDTISDSSDIPERLIAGQFTRFTLTMEIDDAYLFSSPIRDVWHVEYELEEKLDETLRDSYSSLKSSRHVQLMKSSQGLSTSRHEYSNIHYGLPTSRHINNNDDQGLPTSRHVNNATDLELPSSRHSENVTTKSLKSSRHLSDHKNPQTLPESHKVKRNSYKLLRVSRHSGHSSDFNELPMRFHINKKDFDRLMTSRYTNSLKAQTLPTSAGSNINNVNELPTSRHD